HDRFVLSGEHQDHARPRAELERELAPWRDRFPEVRVEYRFPTGIASTALLRGTDGVAAIVTGTRRRGPLARALLGSTSRAVLRYSPVPVIVTNPRLDHRLERRPQTLPLD